MDVTMGVGTDVATVCFFHPDDLAGYADAPMTWYATSYAVGREFERGRLIAFSTGSDGYFSVRVTDEGLSDREREYAGASCEFRLSVTNGRLAIDNTDGLPSDEQQSDLTEYKGGWLELANGDYRAMVTAIGWSKEPGAIDDNGRSTPGSLTSFVLSLEPVADLTPVSFPSGLPQLRPDKTEPTFTLDFANERRLVDQPTPEAPPLHIVMTGGPLRPPGHRVNVSLMEQAPKALTFVDVIVANDQQPGSIGVYGQHRSSVGSGGSGWTYGVDVVAPVRIVEVIQDSEWPLCDFEPLSVSTDVIGDELRARLLEAFANYARAWHLPAADFQIARMDYLSDDRAMTNALIGLLTPGAGQTAWLLAANNRERAEALLQQLGG